VQRGTHRSSWEMVRNEVLLQLSQLSKNHRPSIAEMYSNQVRVLCRPQHNDPASSYGCTGPISMLAVRKVDIVSMCRARTKRLLLTSRPH
jgi:hypothetical protein